MDVFLIFPKSQQAQKELEQQLAKYQADQALKKHPASALRHRGEAGTDGRSGEAYKSAAIIHSRRADQPQQPVCSFFICFSLNLAPQGSHRAARWLQAPAERKVSHADRSPPAVFWIPPAYRQAHRKVGRPLLPPALRAASRFPRAVQLLHAPNQRSCHSRCEAWSKI